MGGKSKPAFPKEATEGATVGHTPAEYLVKHELLPGKSQYHSSWLQLEQSERYKATTLHELVKYMDAQTKPPHKLYASDAATMVAACVLFGLSRLEQLLMMSHREHRIWTRLSTTAHKATCYSRLKVSKSRDYIRGLDSDHVVTDMINKGGLPVLATSRVVQERTKRLCTLNVFQEASWNSKPQQPDHF